MQKGGNRRDLARFFSASREFRTARPSRSARRPVPAAALRQGWGFDLCRLARPEKSGQVGRRPRALDWHVFYVRSDVPLIAEIILHRCVAVAVGLIRWFLE